MHTLWGASEPRPADSPPLLVLAHKPAEWAVTSPIGCVIFLSLLQSWMGSWGGSSEVAFVQSKGTGHVPSYHPSDQLILMGLILTHCSDLWPDLLAIEKWPIPPTRYPPQSTSHPRHLLNLKVSNFKGPFKTKDPIPGASLVFQTDLNTVSFERFR